MPANAGALSGSCASRCWTKPSIQLTEAKTCQTCQKQASRPMTKTNRMNPFKYRFAMNTGKTCGNATKVPKPTRPKATSIRKI